MIPLIFALLITNFTSKEASYTDEVLHLKGDVHINMNEEISLDGSEGWYHKEDHTLKVLNATLSKNSDHIKSDALNIKLDHEMLNFENVQGDITSLIVPNVKCTIKGETLLWDHKTKVLTLAGNAHLSQKDFCTLRAPTLYIKQSLLYQTPLMETFWTEGETVIIHPEHTLICHQGLHFLRKTLTLTAKGGISYISKDTKAYADQLALEGVLTRYKLEPHTLSLKNNIAISYQSKDCLADTLFYDHPTGNIRLTGDRVLFKQDKVTLSAHTVLINKDGIKGIGPVRFTFIESELERFQKTFPRAMMGL